MEKALSCKQYVISWSATCTPYGKTDVTVIIKKNPFYGGHVHFEPANPHLPEIDKDLTQKRGTGFSSQWNLS